MVKRYSSSYKPFSVRRKERKSRNNLIFTIIGILFLMYATLTWILPNLIGGLSLVNKLKTQPKPSPLITEDTTLAPPVLSIPYEATNTGIIKIKGYASPKTKVEIYVDEELKTTADVQDDGTFLATNIDLSLGTNNITGKTVEGSTKSLPSKSIRITYSNQKPKLSLTSPTNNQLVKGGDKKVTVSGSTDPGNQLTANGIKLIVNSDGNFSQSIAINEGENTITVVSQDTAGNQNQSAVVVKYEP